MVAPRRHLPTQGLAKQLIDIKRAAIASRAPFLKQDVTLAADVSSQWSRTLKVDTRYAAPEDAMVSDESYLAERSFVADVQRRPDATLCSRDFFGTRPIG